MMARLVGITTYQAYVAACSRGFNEWRQWLIIRSTDTSTYCDLRFVDDPDRWQPYEKVRESGPSQVYLPSGSFQNTLHLLQSEKPLYLVLYESSNRVIIQTGPEPPGEEEPSP